MVRKSDSGFGYFGRVGNPDQDNALLTKGLANDGELAGSQGSLCPMELSREVSLVTGGLRRFQKHPGHLD